MLKNPYASQRLSRCLTCRHQTFARKFPLVINIEDFGVLVLGKTCKYCAICEIIGVHQHELAELVEYALKVHRSDADPEQYFVVGVMEKKDWKKSLSKPTTMADMQGKITFIKKYVELYVQPGGWFRKED